METPKQDWLDKIRKLLAQAENEATPPAAREVLMQKAADLAAKFGIDMAMAAADLPTGRREQVAERTLTVPPPFAFPKAGLLHRMSQVMNVRVWITDQAPGSVASDYPITIGMAGFDADMTRLEVLFTSLLVQSAYSMVAAAHLKPRWESREEFLGAFYEGYTAAVVKRLKLAEERAKAGYAQTHAGGPGTDLVLKSRGDEVARFVAARYPNMGKANGPRSPQSTGRAAGYAEGQRANLGGTSVGSRADHTAI